jgi:orotate phosphoribosyltransferase
MTSEATLRTELTTLLVHRSVVRGDFVLASDRRSSFYIDARRTTMSAAGLALIGPLGVARLRARGWAPRVVGGLTLGADPVAYALALAGRDLPLDAFTIRKEPKDHGTGRRIEGCFEPGMAAVVVEDVITSGQSARRAIEAVEAAGGRVLGVLAVVDRQEEGRAALEDAGYPVEALLTVADLGLG